MNLKRIIRDAFIMISFCGTFYVSTFMWGKVDDKPPMDTNFSSSRIAADEYIHSRRWQLAADRYKRMTESDPCNGFAWYRLGTCYNNVRFESQHQIRREKKSTEPSIQKIERWQDIIAEHDQLALDALQTARNFLRYRGKSLYQLAVIHADRMEFEQALEVLRDFVDSGYWTFNGLDRVDRFGSGGAEMVDHRELANSQTRLHAYQEFWALVEKEREEQARGETTKSSRQLMKKSH